MANQRDYYEILGVSRSDSPDELKKAYRRLAMKHHPDRNPNDESAAVRFKEIQEAYAVLSDSKKRAAYDQFGHAGVQGNAGGAGFGGFDFSDLGDMFGDVFSSVFGGGSGRHHPRGKQRGSDLGYELQITLEEAVHGVSREITIQSTVQCKTCQGSGSQSGKGTGACKHCNGSGQTRISHGFLQVQQTCPVCRGMGEVMEDPCRSCHGEGRAREKKKLNVKIPAGVDNGDRVRLAGEGEAGFRGGEAGDLYVEVRVKSHSVFEREGGNLHCIVPISFMNAVVGGEIEVPTLQGVVKLTIPAETQTGTQLRLRGKGMKLLRGHGTGDLICHIKVETPIGLNTEQKELLKQFQASVSANSDLHMPQAKNWLQSIKQFFRV